MAEYVGPHDAQFRSLVRGRKTLYLDWSQAAFEEVAERHFTTVQHARGNANQAGWVTVAHCLAGAYNDGVAAPRSGTVPKRRLVWLVFDELSQAAVFDHHPTGLPLANSDHLRSESFCAAAASAPAMSTMESIPARVLAQRVAKVEPRGPGSLWVLSGRGHPGFEWGSATNIFDRTGDVLRADSAVVGWFHPYGRLLHHSLARRLRFRSFATFRAGTAGVTAGADHCTISSPADELKGGGSGPFIRARVSPSTGAASTTNRQPHRSEAAGAGAQQVR